MWNVVRGPHLTFTTQKLGSRVLARTSISIEIKEEALRHVNLWVASHASTVSGGSIRPTVCTVCSCLSLGLHRGVTL
jgi:hypothetical protein